MQHSVSLLPGFQVVSVDFRGKDTFSISNQTLLPKITTRFSPRWQEMCKWGLRYPELTLLFTSVKNKQGKANVDS